MITFETKMDPETGLWQFRRVGTVWSRELSLTRCMVEMRKATLAAPEPKEWSKPLVVGIKRPKAEPQRAKNLYEIHGGKVRRIPASTKERNEQEIAEILAALEALEA